MIQTLIDMVGTIGLGIVYLVIVLVLGYGIFIIDTTFFHPPKDDEIEYKETTEEAITPEELEAYKQYEAVYG